jgi:hypothetical protein
VAGLALSVFLAGMSATGLVVRLALAFGFAFVCKELLPSFDPFVLGTLFLDPTVYIQVPAVRTAEAFIDYGAAAAIVSVTLAACRLLEDCQADAEPAGTDAVPDNQTATILATGLAPEPATLGPDSPPASVLAPLSRHLSALRTLLFASSLVLVLGVIQVGTLYGWGAALVRTSRAAVQVADTALVTNTRAVPSVEDRRAQAYVRAAATVP